MRNMKKFLALLLCVAMTLSLAACSKSNDPQNPVNTAAPEYVYTAEYSELLKGTSSITPQLYTEDGFYSTIYEKVSDEVPEGTMYSYKGMDGTYEYRLYFVSYDGGMSRLENYSPIKPEEDYSAYQEVFTNNSISALTLDADGNLQLIENCFVRYYDGPEGKTMDDYDYWDYLHYDDLYYIRTLDKDGGEISSAKVEIPEENYLYVYSVQPDGQGNVLVGSEMAVMAIAPDGSIAYKVETDNWVDSLVRLRDGQLGVLSYGDNGLVLKMLDVEKKTLGEDLELPRGAWDLIPGAGDYDFYYVSGINLFGYDIQSKTSDRLLNFLNCDVDNSSLGPRLQIREDGSVFGVINTWDSSYDNVTTELVTLSKVPYDTVPHKESIRMAVFDMDYDVRGLVIDFNRHSDQYHIDVTDYNEYSTSDDYSAGLTKLKTEIMANNVPDIIALRGLPYEQLAAKGLLEDLYPFIESDPELSKSDFFEAVFSALEVNGGLYQACPAFSLMTVIGAKSVVGDTPGWTFEDFEAALASMPEGCDPFDYYTTKEDILTACLAMDMDSFVDWVDGKCSFDSEGFINLLKFANRFQDEFNWETYEYIEDESTQNRIAQGRQMLMRASIYSLEDVIYNDFYFGGDGTSSSTTYIGYPTNSGVGNALSLQQGYAMSSRCANKEGAWEFLRSFLTEKYQENIWYMPTNRNVFEAKLKEIMEPRYLTDDNGNKLLDEDGEPIKQSLASYGFEDGTIREIYEMSDQQAADLRSLIETTTKVYQNDSSIYDIVSAEAQAYFLGQKPVEEVARLIQSKVNIYVNEQK